MKKSIIGATIALSAISTTVYALCYYDGAVVCHIGGSNRTNTIPAGEPCAGSIKVGDESDGLAFTAVLLTPEIATGYNKAVSATGGNVCTYEFTYTCLGQSENIFLHTSYQRFVRASDAIECHFN